MIADQIYDLLPSDIPKIIGDLPSTDDNIVAIMEYQGYDSSEYFGDDSPSIYKPIVKTVIRNKSYTEGRDWANRIAGALHRHHDSTFMSIMLTHPPVYLGRNDQKTHEFQVTFIIKIRSDLDG